MKLSSTQRIVLSFLLVIIIGSILLSLPIANKNNEFLPYIDALFTAVSCTCVTGLSTLVVSDTFNLFGQIIMIILIQIGGLGLITLMGFVMKVSKTKFKMENKMTLAQLLSNNNLDDMGGFIFKVVKYTFGFELVGALLIALVLVPKYDLGKGLFYSLYLSISAFCNAGFDPLGATSLQGYLDEPFLMIVIMLLIICGGLGFAIWFEVKERLVLLLKKQISFKKFRQGFSFHSKVVMITSLGLIFIPAIIMLILEWNNPNTIATFSIPKKITAILFESIALRTAGFTSIDYSGLLTSTSLVMMVLMFIGGSVGGTAGGIKTTTFIVIMAHVIASVRQNEKVVLWKRSINKDTIIKALNIFYMNCSLLIIGTFILTLFEDYSLLDIIFEVCSALATVGSTRGITSSLQVVSKLVIILIMFIGRIGIITLLMSVSKKNKQDILTYPDSNILV